MSGVAPVGPADGTAVGVPTWVVGAGGLVGSAVVRALRDPFVVTGLAWADPTALARGFDAAARTFADRVAGGGSAAVVWTAGRAVIASSAADVEAETNALGLLLAAIERHVSPAAVTVVVASSAGGVHAGSVGAPFDESTVPVPLSPYGHGKLVQEAVLADWVARTGARGVAARIATVYGTRQDPAKPQGLVTHLCRAIVTRQPVRVFVPLDARRHLVWEDDAGAALIALAHHGAAPAGTSVVRLVAGGPAVTVGEVIATVARVTRRRPPVLRVTGAESALHGVDLRFAPRHGPGVASTTPLVVGVGRVWRAVLRSSGSPARPAA